MARIRSSYWIYVRHQHSLVSLFCVQSYHQFSVIGRLALVLCLLLESACLACGLRAYGSQAGALLTIGIIGCTLALSSFPLSLLLRTVWSLPSACSRGIFATFIAAAAALVCVYLGFQTRLADSGIGASCLLAATAAPEPMHAVPQMLAELSSSSPILFSDSVFLPPVPTCFFSTSLVLDLAACAGIGLCASLVGELVILFLVYLAYCCCCPRLACCVVDQEIVNDDVPSRSPAGYNPYFQVL